MSVTHIFSKEAVGNAQVIDTEAEHRAPITRLTFMAHLRTFPVLEMRDELRQADGTLAWGDSAAWSALTHAGPAPRRQG